MRVVCKREYSAICLNIFRITCVTIACFQLVGSEDSISSTILELTPNEDGDRVENEADMRGTLFKTAKEYHCAVDKLEDEELLLYGTKAWTFPVQDVNLTISYPAINSSDTRPNANFVVTMFRVILFIDGGVSRAFITSGGLLEDNITFTFICQEIGMIGYKIWLYGVENEKPLNLTKHSC